MIGEKIKIGFDGSQVKRGLMGLMGGFNKLSRGVGRVTRQVGIGFARAMGATMFGTLLSGLRAVPNELEGLARLNKELDIMQKSTGIAREEFLALRQAVSKASGRDADEATDFLRDVSERLGEAFKDYESTPAQAFRELGLQFEEFQGKNVAEQMKLISEGFTSYQQGNGFNAAMFQINELLGEVGKQMIPLFLNYEKGMIKARNQTAGLAKQLKTSKDDLETIFDIRQTIGRRFSEFSVGLLGALKNTGFIDKINDFFDNLDIIGLANDLKNIIDDITNGIQNGGIFNYLKEKATQFLDWISEKIAAAIKKGIGDAMGASPLGGIMDFFGGSKKKPKESIATPKAPTDENYKNFLQQKWDFGPKSRAMGPFDPNKIYQPVDKVVDNTDTTNDILRDIKYNTMSAKYA